MIRLLIGARWLIGVAVAMKNDGRKFISLCLSDGLPCSCSIKGVGIGFCVKNSRGKMLVCPRFSDVSILEFGIRKKIKGEFEGLMEHERSECDKN